MDRCKIKNGGAYLIDLTSGRSPEIIGQHYCYAFKSKSDKNLYLCFIMTSKTKRNKEKYTFSLPENPDGIIMLKHTKLISSNRFLNTLKNNRKESIILSSSSVKQIFNEYNKYLLDIQRSAVKAAEQREKQKSYDNMYLKMFKSVITINLGEEINPQDYICYANGTITVPEIDISKEGILKYEFILTDSYGQIKTEKFTLEVKAISQEQHLSKDLKAAA